MVVCSPETFRTHYSVREVRLYPAFRSKPMPNQDALGLWACSIDQHLLTVLETPRPRRLKYVKREHISMDEETKLKYPNLPAIERGLVCLTTEKYPEAVACFTEACERNPSDANAWHLKGETLLRWSQKLENEAQDAFAQEKKLSSS